MRALIGTVVAAAVVAACGCDSGPRFYRVTGTVTLDGKPLDTADILFTDARGALGPEPGKVTNGAFELQAKEGKKKVTISSSKVIPGSPTRGAGGEPVPEEILPEHYYDQTKTELTADVSAGGPNKFEFKLTSAKKK
ncbi:MAG: hypothetical protein ACRC33_00750 [Gemmataceae bacterium]